ncbi:MAG: zinc ribbon domain-containing protein [Defluviitaleaceae bacterium]|nr:zinc ribbon domain-containing protein [Defluviitaleaceae bacterium]
MKCGKCSRKVEKGARFCSVCGAPGTAFAQEDSDGLWEAYELKIGRFAALHMDNMGEASLTAPGLLLSASLLFRMLAVWLVILLAMPFYTVHHRFIDTINGFHGAFFFGYINIPGVLLLVIPLLLFLLFQFRRAIYRQTAITQGKLYLITAGLSVLGLVCLFTVNIWLEAYFVLASAGFVLSMFTYLGCALLSAGFIVAVRKQKMNAL